MNLFCAACLASTLIAATGAKTARDMTPEEREAKRAEMMQRMLQRTGGYVEVKDARTKVLAIVNYQKDVERSVLDSIATNIWNGLRFPVVISDNRPDDAGVVIELRDSDYPATVLTSQENGFGMLNIRGLKKDSPSVEVLNVRVRKELWRTIVYTLGGGNDDQPMCLMKPIATLSALDALESTCPCPMSFHQIEKAAAMFGVGPVRRVTYRRACEEGWAPAPTNDLQRAVFEKVKAEQNEKPTTPIVIKPGDKPASK